MFVTNSLTGGGAERSTNIIVNELLKSNIKTCLVAINDSPLDFVVPVCEVFELKRPWQGNLLTVLKAYVRLQKCIWRWKPDFVVLNCDIPELLGAFTVGSHRLIAVEHATYPWINRISLGKIVRKLLKFRKTIWVAVSNHLSIWQVKDKPDFVINNPVINSEASCDHATGPINRLVYVGRLSNEKQPSWVIEILKLTSLPGLILGDGVLKKDLEWQAIASNLQVEFAGFVENPWESLIPGDLLIVPSKFEGDGLVIVEALARNIPMLLNDIPDLRRFGLPDANYCKTPIDFSKRISDSRNDISTFDIDADLIVEMLMNRDVKVIADKWVQLFSKVM